MNIDRKELESDKSRLWELFEQYQGVSGYQREIQLLCDKITVSSYGVIKQENQDADRYEYLRFCLKCIEADHEKMYFDRGYEFVSAWAEVVDSDDFHAALEDELLETVKQNKSGNVHGVQKIAQDLTSAEHYTRAIRYFQAVQEYINNPSAWDRWAACYAAENDMRTAVATIENGLGHYPDNQLLICNLAFYLHKNRDATKALKVLDDFFNRVATQRYEANRFYIYAINLKMKIYNEFNMSLQELIEYSRLSTTGGCDCESIKQGVARLTPQIGVLNYG
ncbi:MAG TPA: hypothetical protein ENJ08_03875 [Gammaproteobacteria bacterium]|nr:hypothetical protein [Gammaproteobacteria bacterium]